MWKTENVDIPVSGVLQPDRTISRGSGRVNYHNFITGGSEKPHVDLAGPDPPSLRTLKVSMTILRRLLVVSVDISLEIYVVSSMNHATYWAFP